eukprot:CAMPEP_0171065024 /NCGR_PEP_ID=MMETSP0766_2-20121228/6617_1 /TAXON_ID=439317 /ORGANISM="Gambierdiscus australes, Strain CAWD 149" /LENGTH=45 /DNA_ID= /DNA_START= /DNA_END= /DNA_ORIENTATION=
MANECTQHGDVGTSQRQKYAATANALASTLDMPRAAHAEGGKLSA